MNYCRKQSDVLETALGILQLDYHLEDQGLKLEFSSELVHQVVSNTRQI